KQQVVHRIVEVQCFFRWIAGGGQQRQLAATRSSVSGRRGIVGELTMPARASELEGNRHRLIIRAEYSGHIAYLGDATIGVETSADKKIDVADGSKRARRVPAHQININWRAG